MNVSTKSNRSLWVWHAKYTALSSVLAVMAIPSALAAAPPVVTLTTEEVVVTARRKDESLARVPIAVSALGAEQLEERQVRTDADLQFAVPGLTIRQTQGNNSLTYSIRGQSADTFSGSPSAVVAYFNEVPLTISGASTFYDLQSVQVLKGPQGTLFGRNTTGGAVLYTTAKPTNELGGKLTVRAGNYDLQEFEGVANLPIVDDKVLLRAAFNATERDGYIDNIVTGKTHGDIDRKSARVSLTIKPNDLLENTTVFGYSRVDGTNTGATYVYSVYAPGQTHNGYALNGGAAFFYPGLLDYVNQQKFLGPYKTSHPYDADHVGEDEIFVNTTILDFSDSLQLKNIFGYSAADTDSEQPALGAPYVTFATRNIDTGRAGNELDVESFSDELQVLGNVLNGDLTYVAGIYLQSMRTDTLWPQTYFRDTAFQATATNNFRIETETQAFYAQGSYALTGQMRVTAGMRYTIEDVSIEQLSQSDYYASPLFAQKQDDTFEAPSWEVGLEYDISDALFSYIKTRGSFRSGGFNGSAPPIDADAIGGGNKFDKETVKDVEAGLKYQGALLDRPARMNLAIYKQWVDDVQRIEFPTPPPGLIPGDPPSIAVTANIPEMEVQGVEIDGSLMPAEWLELGLAATYTDADFTDGQVTLFGTRFQYSPVANTPEYTVSLWAQVGVPIDPSLGGLNLRVEYYKQDNFYFSNTADSITPDTELPSYDLVNARLNWSNFLGTNLSGALFVKNLTDEEYFAGGMPLGASLGHNAAVVGEPRTYGVELSYQF